MAHGIAGQSNSNVPEREDTEGLIRFQSSILEAVAFGYEDREILDRICLLGEKMVPDSIATIMLLDDAGKLNIHAAPSASEEIASRLSGLVPGPESGSCGNAAYRKEPVFVSDTFHDPRWNGLRHLAEEYNLQSCWSVPIFSEGRRVTGTFALTGFEARSPSPFQMRLMDIASSIIAIVIERRKRDIALRQSQALFGTLFEEATDTKMLLSEEGRILDINRIGHERLGYAKAEMVGKFASDFVTSENVDKVPQRLDRVKQERHATYESAQLRKDGTVMPVEISTIVIELDGRLAYYSILRDITKRKEAETSLQESEKRFRDLVETTTDWIWETDADLRYTYVSPRIKDLLGYTPDELIGKTPFDLMPQEMAKQRADEARTYVERQAPINQLQTVRRHRDGHEVFVETSGLPLLDISGKLTGFRGVTRDITRRKEMENALMESEASLRDIILHAPIGLATVSLEGRFREVNESLCAIVGYGREELESITFQEITHPDDLESDLGNVRRLLAGEISVYKMEKRYVRKDGEIVWVQLTVSLLRDAESAPTHFIAQIEDITERKLSEQRLSEALEMMDSVINAIPDLLFELDQNGIYLNVWAQVPELLAAPKEFLLGHSLAEMLPPDSAKMVLAALAEADQQGRSYGKVMPLELPDGMKWFELSVAKKQGISSTEKRFIVLSRDITERMEAQARLNHLAYYDTLTDLPNRRFLVEKLNWALVQAKRYGRSLAVMFLDLDGFKQINDTLGHDIGDELLKAVAAKLTSCVRKGDIVSRQGGDEFIIVLPEISHPDDAALVAEKIIDSLTMPVDIGMHRIKIGTSIGIAVYPVDGADDVGDLMKKADRAMYEVKASGRNGYRLFGS